MKSQTEIELKFVVPPAARVGVLAELARGSATLDRTSLTALYLDTNDRRLAQAGMVWRLRREGRRWIQTLKASGSNSLERFEHEAIRPGATADAAEHAGTTPGDRLITLLRRARADGIEPEVRFRTEVRRTARRIRTRGAVVDVAFDEGRLLSADASQRLREIEFVLVSGSPMAMLRLAERWRKRFALVYDPRSKAERGDRLADGTPFPPLRKASRPSYPDDATATEAFGVVLDECLAQITYNSIGLIEGDPAQRIEHVHQLRVGIRRLRSALRSFQGWVPPPPADLVESLRSLFATLGLSRDSDVLGSGVVAELARAGAPELKLPPGPAGPDPVDAVRDTGTQRVLLAWIAWRTTFAPAPEEPAVTLEAELPIEEHHAASLSGMAESEPSEAASADSGGPQANPPQEPTKGDDPRRFRRNVRRRLRQWHARIASDWKSFDALDDIGLHALRKRIKRQRYAVEFFAPLLRRRQVDRYLGALSAIQDRMGALTDLFVARDRYQALGTPDPAAWFALGWLAARIAELRELAKP
ncbi:MAG: CHAD domain-containing protein, partial [Pseudomonadota bacterium]|nr:CHAD domain-containing protein [Pseudomonadota bacterium]